MKKLIFFVAAIIVVTVLSTIGCAHTEVDPLMWKQIPADTIVGGTHLEIDQDLGCIIIEKEDGSERNAKIFFKEGDSIEFTTQDGHHFFKVWLENGQLQVREEFLPVINWTSIPTDTIVGGSRFQFDTENNIVVIEDSLRDVISLEETNIFEVYPYDGYHYMEIWLENGKIHVRDSLISPEP